MGMADQLPGDAAVNLQASQVANPWAFSRDGQFRKNPNGAIEVNQNGSWVPMPWSGSNSQQSHDSFWNAVSGTSYAPWDRSIGQTLGQMQQGAHLTGADEGSWGLSYNTQDQNLINQLNGLTNAGADNQRYGVKINQPGTNADQINTGASSDVSNLMNGAVQLKDAQGNVSKMFIPSSIFDPINYGGGGSGASETFDGRGQWAGLSKLGVSGSMPGIGPGVFLDPNQVPGNTIQSAQMTDRVAGKPTQGGVLGPMGDIAKLAAMYFTGGAAGLYGLGAAGAGALAGGVGGLLSGGGLQGALKGAALGGVGGFGMDQLGNLLPSGSGFMSGGGVGSTAGTSLQGIPDMPSLNDFSYSQPGSFDYGSGVPQSYATQPQINTGGMPSGYSPTTAGGNMGEDWFNQLFGNGTSNDTGNGVGDVLGGGSGSDTYANYPTSGLSIPTTGNSSIDQLLAKLGLGGLTGGASSVLGGSGGKLLAAGLGGLLGSQNGAQQSGTQTTTQTPWAAQQPYLMDLFNKAQGAQQSTAGYNPLQTQALTSAGQPNTLQGPATNTLQNTINGSLKNPMLGMDNPYLTNTIDQANNDVSRAFMPAMNAANHASGSFGNSGIADIYSKNLADQYSKNATGLRFQDYTNQQGLNENQLNRQLTASTAAPTFFGNNLANSQNQYTLGGQAQNQPFDNLAKYGSLIGGQYGSATNSPIFTNPNAGLLGGALAGSQVYNTLFKGNGG